MINAGYNNYIKKDKILSVASVQGVVSSPIKRAMRAAENKDMVIDLTAGRKTRSVIFTDSGHVILSAVEGKTITQRINKDVIE